ncbi:MAG: DNA-processing protein DprA [Bryobacterales bacterium]|nr:DNA-processing protein DprA [Bryobacterales bacterium]MDE0295899.1 DNA-processing protein DprA [Bryobacterales bacterium]
MNQSGVIEANDRAAVPLPPVTFHRGNLRLLEEPLTALFCSIRCPGDLILKTYDLAREMRDAGAPVIGGFQTPMEKECLRLLLRGTQPVVVCPARGIDKMRIPRDWRAPLEEDRFLVLSPFPSTRRRPTVKLAARRNDLVANLARRVLIVHAAPGGKTEAFARKLAESGKPLLTLDSPANANLMEMGARALSQVTDLVV